jgi:hypothetical protein
MAVDFGDDDQTSTKPTHVLMGRLGNAKHGNRLGVCWLNRDGSLAVRLNVGVTLSWNDGLLLRAFPQDGADSADADGRTQRRGR